MYLLCICFSLRPFCCWDYSPFKNTSLGRQMHSNIQDSGKILSCPLKSRWKRLLKFNHFSQPAVLRAVHFCLLLSAVNFSRAIAAFAWLCQNMHLPCKLALDQPQLTKTGAHWCRSCHSDAQCKVSFDRSGCAKNWDEWSSSWKCTRGQSSQALKVRRDRVTEYF